MNIYEKTGESLAVPGVGGIIERKIGGIWHILMQTRSKEDGFFDNGMLEIPAGKVRAFESVFDALRREVTEETGLHVVSITGESEAPVHTYVDYRVINFSPFACAQNTQGLYPVMVLVFLCQVEGEPLVASDEATGFRWVSVNSLAELLNATYSLYPMHVDTLRKYLDYRK